MGRKASEAEFESLFLELSDRVVETNSPTHWTGARLEAWMDWARGETDMAEAVAQFVEGLTARAQAAGLVKDVRGRTRFRDDLTAGLTAGVLAIGHPRDSRTLRVVDAGSLEVALAVAQHRGEVAAQAAALELERRLQAVMDAVLRCEGDADACADPARNPGLARAAHAARSAGAPDAMIFEAIALARSGESGWEIVPPVIAGNGVRLVVAGAADDAVARAAWATGAIVLAPNRAAAERIAAAESALRGGVSLMGFWSDEGFDIEAFEAAVVLLAKALNAAADGPALLALGGPGRLVDGTRPGLRQRPGAGSGLRAVPDGRAVDRQLGRKRCGPALFDDPDLALRLGGVRLDAAPWAGPIAMAETSDGDTFRVLSDAAIRGLALVGADEAEVHATLLGRSDLEQAPGINHAALLARGFTDHEIAAVEAVLPLVTRLADAFCPAVIGEGFIRDVLGATSEQLVDPQLDLLDLMGFSVGDIAAAEAYVLGDPSLTDAPFLSPETRLAFRAEEDLGPLPRMAMLQALSPALAAPPVADVELPWNATIADTLEQLSAPIAVRLHRAEPPAELVLALPTPTEAPPKAAREPEERIVERVIERERTRRKLPDRRKGYIQKRRSAVTRSTFTPASTTTANSVRSSSTCTRRRRLPLADEQLRHRDLDRACSTACRWTSSSTPSSSPGSSRRGR
jgi:ribonucleoside-diphosphate reductase alpha chain